MKIFKRLIIFLGIVFLLLIILWFALLLIVKQIRIKEVVEKEIERSMGINISIEKMEFSPLLTYIAAKGVTIHNPPGFSESELAYIPSIHFVLDPAEVLIRKKPVIYLFALDLQRLNIVKNKDGKVNLKEIIPIKEQSETQEVSSFRFAVVVLSIGEVTYTDYTGAVKNIRKYPINIKNQAFVDLKDEDELVRLVVYRAIQNTEIGRLINLNVSVVAQISDTMDATLAAAKSGVKSIADIAALPFNLIFGK